MTQIRGSWLVPNKMEMELQNIKNKLGQGPLKDGR
jgi:hypothetical protein